MTSRRIAAAVALAAAMTRVRANAETHEMSATSSVKVETLPGGNIARHAENVQFVPYGPFEEVGGKPHHSTRLATVTTALGARTTARALTRNRASRSPSTT